jgi:hypothetical protein
MNRNLAGHYPYLNKLPTRGNALWNVRFAPLAQFANRFYGISLKFEHRIIGSSNLSERASKIHNFSKTYSEFDFVLFAKYVLRPVFSEPFKYRPFQIGTDQSTQHGCNTAVRFPFSIYKHTSIVRIGDVRICESTDGAFRL